MRLRDYLFGLRVELISPLSPEEVATVLNKQTGSIISIFGQSGIAGWSALGWFNLHWRTALFDNGFQPGLSGRLSSDLGGCRITARYGASLYLRLFLLFWYGFLALTTLAVGASMLAGAGQRTGNEWLLFVIVPVFMAVPLIFHVIGNRNAMNELGLILEFLEEEAQAKPAVRHT